MLNTETLTKTTPSSAPLTKAEIERCPNCRKPTAAPSLCMCAEANALKETLPPTSLKVLVLQHPQEPDKELASATLAKTLFPNVTITVGLSKANLAHALGAPKNTIIDPKKWAVLFLGTQTQKAQFSSEAPQNQFFGLEGIVVLDGNWRQSKTLWWRNPWLLKLKRISLNPNKRSAYGAIRREPRPDCLSTMESIGLSLDLAHGLAKRVESHEHFNAAHTLLTEFLVKYRTTTNKK